MSDAMMFGIATMPYEMAMRNEMSRRQFYANTQRLAAALEAAQMGLRREESDHERTIDQRDAAEDALGRMFQAVTGRPAEWSSAWGYVDAIEEVEEHVAAQAEQPDPNVRYGDGFHDGYWKGREEGWDAAMQRTSDEHVSVVGMPEFDALIDHIYEHGTTSEGVLILADALARALLSRYGRHAGDAQPMPAAIKATIKEALILRHDAGEDQDACDNALNWLSQHAAPVAAQKEDDARDAARYRLLRRKVCIVGESFHIINIKPTYVAPDAAVELDAAIDAATKNEGGAA